MPAAPSLTEALEDPQRLDLLRSTDLLDSPPEEAFDRFTRLASHIMHAPVALISLVDRDRQFFKSQYGLAEPLATKRETPLSHSFCQHLVATAKPLVVNDARQHPLLQNNPCIREVPVIAYLGVPLQTAEGRTLGSLCTIDAKPRLWSAEDVAMLRDIGVWVMTEIQLRLLARHFLSGYLHMRDLELQRDELTHMLVHDLRNPLNSLIMGLELLRKEAPLGQKPTRYMNMAHDAAHLLLRMIGDILDVSKAEAGRLELDISLIPAGEIIALACTQTEAMAHQAGVTVIQDVENDLPVAVDVEKVRRVLVNVISNAIQHTTQPGSVTVRARRTHDLAFVLEISDTGVGMDKAIFERIFEKFGGGSARKGGRVSTGLGLPFCKKAIEAHGGTIAVTSELGRGTTFRIEIPYPKS